MTVEISELCVSCLLGTFAYAVAHLLRAIAELFLFGYEVRYLRVRIASRVRCPAFLSSGLAWCLDLLTALLVSLCLVLYDFGVLSGEMRLVHFAAFGIGFFLMGRLYRRLLLRIVSPILCVALDLFLLAFGGALLPFRAVFLAISHLTRRLLLLCRAEYGKIRKKHNIKRFTARQITLAKSAFLPSDTVNMQ